jgi:hypothetical protein
LKPLTFDECAVCDVNAHRRPQREERTRAHVRHPSVWPVATLLAREQRRHRYLPESSAHPGKVLPALVREAISRFTRRGELMLHPMCSIGTALVEAEHLGRQAIVRRSLQQRGGRLVR